MQHRAILYCTRWYSSVLVLCYTSMYVWNTAQHCAKAVLRCFILMQPLLFHGNANWHKSMLMQTVRNCAKAALRCCILMQPLLFHGNANWHKSMLMQTVRNSGSDKLHGSTHLRLHAILCTINTNACLSRLKQCFSTDSAHHWLYMSHIPYNVV